jgi:hypothetical protein
MTPFDAVIQQIKRRGFHNQRLEDHSDVVSDGVLKGLTQSCTPFATDLSEGIIKAWPNVRTPGARHRKIDLFIGEPDSSGDRNLEGLRLCLENKSVVTAHRNHYARFDDLNETLQVLHRAKSEAVLVATVIVGVAERVLNVPDRVKPLYKKKPAKFEKGILPRLSSGDQRLWDEFDWAISTNRPDDPQYTIKKFRELPVRRPGRTHVVGYDFVLLVPAYIDNVNAPYIVPPGDPKSFGIDVDRDYAKMIETMCKAYTARWHL